MSDRQKLFTTLAIAAVLIFLSVALSYCGATP